MRRLKTPPVIILLIGLPLNILFLFVFSGVNAAGQRVWYLIDDAMISMSYARTFAETGELVWYEGADRVEGFTNPLWTFIMAVPHAVGLQGNPLILSVVVFGMVCVLASGVIAYYLARNFIDGDFVPCLTGVAVTATYPLIFWSMRGMEIGLLTVATLSLVALALKNPATAKILTVVFAICFLGVWTRMDFAVIVGALAAPCVLLYRIRPMWRFVFAAVAGTFSGLGTLTAWRFFYYGEVVPNTYTLKMTGSSLLDRLPVGLWENLEFVGFLAFVGLSCVHMWKTRPASRIVASLLSSIVAVTFLYSVYVGGDAWPPMSSRYIVPGLVAGTIIAIPGIVSVLKSFSQKLIVPIVFVLVVFSTSSFGYQLLIFEQTFFLHQEYEAIVWTEGVRDITENDAVVAVTHAGMGQYVTKRKTIDILGKMDPQIAKMNSRREIFWPGHTKWDLRYSIAEKRPDIVINVWGPGGTPEEEEYRDVIASGYTKECFSYTYKGVTYEKAVLVENRTTKVDRTKLYACQK